MVFVDLGVELVDFDVLRDEPAFEAVALEVAELLAVVGFFAAGFLDADFADDAFDVFDLAAPDVFEEPDLLREGLDALLPDPEDRDELDFALEDFFVVAMIVSPLIKRIQTNKQLCKEHTIQRRARLVTCLTIFVSISIA